MATLISVKWLQENLYLSWSCGKSKINRNVFTGAVCNLSTGNFRVNDLKSHLSYADDTFLSSVIHYTDIALKVFEHIRCTSS